MELENQSNGPIISRAGAATGLQTFISNVFSWMTAALVITGVVSYLFAANDALFGMLRSADGGHSILGYVAMFAPLGFVLALSAGVQKFSYPVLMVLFIAFSVLMGVSMSYIFHIYAGATIAKTFFITAGTFGVMAFLGYTTKTDLTSMGRLAFMGLIGIIIASIANFFFQNGMMDFIISILGVIIFTALTAYDMQRIKQMGMTLEAGTEVASKAALMGALSLYLDFINLFLFLLRLMGGRN
jgi:FtsH-binding integral membrane protein